MSERRRRKKSETLEVRVEHELKDALMHRAQTEGRSASDIVRESIGAYLAEPEKETRKMLLLWKPAAALGAAGAAILWGGLASGPAVAMPDLKAMFDAMDRNGDRSVSMEEFAGHAQDRMFAVRHHAGAHHPPAGAKPMMLPLRKDAPPPPHGGAAPSPEMLQGHFAQQDANKDGKVDFAEFQAHHRQMMRAGFAAVDGNGDGSIDRAEYEAQVKAAPHAGAAAEFGEVDADGDGKLSEAEYFGHS